MSFLVLENGKSPPREPRNQLYLVEDNWNDLFTFQTQYSLLFVDETGEATYLGDTKIGHIGLTKDRPSLSTPFEKLSEEYFSLGQKPDYYQEIHKRLGKVEAFLTLEALRDLALHPERIDALWSEEVIRKSLFRAIKKGTVKRQFKRVANGGSKLDDYHFCYWQPDYQGKPVKFHVRPESLPPTNVQILIGSNGVGKTHLLKNMAQSLVFKKLDSRIYGEFEFIEDSDKENPADSGRFENVVSVSFSAFDEFTPIVRDKDIFSDEVGSQYIGLKETVIPSGDATVESLPIGTYPIKTNGLLATDFANSLKACRESRERSKLLAKAIDELESNTIFEGFRIKELLTPSTQSQVELDELETHAKKLFSTLSSGHKIVLLSVSTLVASVEERTLVLIDEPESHLHPPLLSSYIRALSDLLVEQNGVAIIATHSPVVLQEVPKECVVIVAREGNHLVFEQPELETFGENVGILTREVFDLEVTASGFHKLLKTELAKSGDYSEILKRFSNKLGGEARAILRGLIRSKQVNVDNEEL